MQNFNLKIRQSNKTVYPLGVNGLSVSIEKESNRVFYRSKLNGSLIFAGDSYEDVKEMQDHCCKVIDLDIFRKCSENDAFLKTIINAKKFDWNNEMCEAQITPEISDIYKILYKYWEKKINVLEIPANRNLRHISKKIVNNDDLVSERAKIVAQGGLIISERWHSSSEKVVWFRIVNDYGRTLNDVIFHIIKKTFQTTELNYILPATIEELSYFLTSEKNICTGRTNICANSIVFDASDIVDPTSEQNATGLMANGKPNESMAISFKQLLEELKALFDIEWFIDSDTGKLRLEHSSFIERGGSYTQDVVGLDLTAERYKSDFLNYKYSFKNELDNIALIDEVKITLNENLNKSDKSYLAPISISNSEYGLNEYGFLRCDDFDFGNIRYDNDCQESTSEPTRNTLTSQLFYTHFEGIEFVDTNIDITKWVLLEVELEPSSTSIYQVKKAKTERLRVNESIKNANYSATSLVRDFHRWNRPYPQGYMNFNDNAIAGTITAKGVLRDMYSVKNTKLLKPFVVPFCCEDPAFNSNKLILMPNGLKGNLKRANFDFASETLELVVMAENPCAIGVTYPDGTDEGGGECPNAGTLLRVERYTDTYYLFDGDPCDQDDRVKNYYSYQEIENQRFVYADGYCGEYKVDGLTPFAATYYKYDNTGYRITAQDWCNLTPDEQNSYFPYTQCV